MYIIQISSGRFFGKLNGDPLGSKHETLIGSWGFHGGFMGVSWGFHGGFRSLPGYPKIGWSWKKTNLNGFRMDFVGPYDLGNRQFSMKLMFFRIFHDPKECHEM